MLVRTDPVRNIVEPARIAQSVKCSLARTQLMDSSSGNATSAGMTDDWASDQLTVKEVSRCRSGNMQIRLLSLALKLREGVTRKTK